MSNHTFRVYPERRAFPRWPVALEGRSDGRTGSSKCLITEISEGGFAIVTGQTVRPGDVLTVAWRLDDDAAPIQVCGVVRDMTPQFVGIEFLNITLADRLRIGQFIVHRATPPQ